MSKHYSNVVVTIKEVSHVNMGSFEQFLLLHTFLWISLLCFLESTEISFSLFLLLILSSSKNLPSYTPHFQAAQRSTHLNGGVGLYPH